MDYICAACSQSIRYRAGEIGQEKSCPACSALSTVPVSPEDAASTAVLGTLTTPEKYLDGGSLQPGAWVRYST